MLEKTTWRACCPTCRIPYIGRAFTEEQRRQPETHPGSGRQMRCHACKTVIVPGDRTMWREEGPP